MKPLLYLLFIAMAFGCTSKKKINTPTTTATKPAPAYPMWIADKIKEIQSKPVQKTKSVIIEYTYQGKKVYYIPAECCDRMNPLYNEEGKIICHPDGGITGRGDKKCLDFDSQQKGKKLWADPRQSKPIED